MTPEPVVPQSSSDVVGRVLQYWDGDGNVRGEVANVEERGEDWIISLEDVHTAALNSHDWSQAANPTRTLKVWGKSPIHELKDGRCLWETQGGIVFILPPGSDLMWRSSTSPEPPPAAA